ncbi:NADP-dependent oxidoreductase [Salegentibacter maritimus]|uniref:NADP-dependent oxidoreductase n=1 Tax=Salegentibacter maritimus TaxID=2794347 RepID=UPI0018E46933|nr:NADP-dependent oxidoreductase [Salegentibacter maritimus]MBI6117871.1 NADP-dependent oxidoreductase [Salegentibacter maritimus]
MKALQIKKYGEIKDSLSINEIEKPSVNSNQILVEVKAASINPIDYKIAQGQLKELLALNLPVTIGFDVSGVVAEKGTDVSDFEIGDEVYSRVPQEEMGTVAEFAVISADKVAKKPENISFEEASGLPLTGITAIQALEKADIKEDNRILIHAGSGGVGSFAIQYAKAKGAIVYTTTSSKNVDWVKALGADRVIDYKEEDYKQVANNLDIVFDTLGDYYTLEAFEITKEGGVVTSIVGPPDEDSAKIMGIPNYQLPEELSKLVKEKSVVYKHTWMQPNAAQLNEIKTMVEAGDIKPTVDLIYDFKDGIDAYEYLATGRAEGKVIISLT